MSFCSESDCRCLEVLRDPPAFDLLRVMLLAVEVDLAIIRSRVCIGMFAPEVLCASGPRPVQQLAKTMHKHTLQIFNSCSVRLVGRRREFGSGQHRRPVWGDAFSKQHLRTTLSSCLAMLIRMFCAWASEGSLVDAECGRLGRRWSKCTTTGHQLQCFAGARPCNTRMECETQNDGSVVEWTEGAWVNQDARFPGIAP